MNKLSKRKKTVLFLCTGNSARSQMAEALLRHKAGEHFEVYSAGTHPEKIDERTITALERFGLSSKSLTSKNISDFSGKTFNYVISLCDKANQECRAYSGAKKQIAWDFPDPKSRVGTDPFATTLNELSNRLSMFLLIEAKGTKELPIGNNKVNANLNTQLIGGIDIDPIVFYKCLTDEIRLKTLMLTNYYGELCVCELMEALQEESQPKISRNLAILKKAKIIIDRKHGQWVFYRINTNLPLWIKRVISQTTENNISLIISNIEQLSIMNNRPDKASFC